MTERTNFSAYSILQHRHVPEVLQISGLEEREFSFTAQLLPIDRGILETIYFRTSPGITAETLLDAYDRRYSGEPFTRPPGAPWWSAPSTTWSKAPPGRPSRT